MKRMKWISIDEYNLPEPEDYSDVPYIVEEDASIQPAVALQMAINRYGINRLYTGYTSPTYNDDIPTAPYRPSVEDAVDYTKSVLAERGLAGDETDTRSTDGVEPAPESPPPTEVSPATSS